MGLIQFTDFIGRPLHRAVVLVKLVLFRIYFLAGIGEAADAVILVVVCLVMIRFRFAIVGSLLTDVAWLFVIHFRLHLG